MTRILIKMCVFIMAILLAAVGGHADILLPPAARSFASDVTIEQYVKGEPLKLFSYVGEWHIVRTDDSVSFVGTARHTPIYLVSNDKLSKTPKSFRFDFKIADMKSEYGFIYGDIGVVVRENKMYPAVFNNKSKRLKANSKAGITITRGIQEINTVDITTGYDPTGGKGQVCVIYINNTGLTFQYNNKDQPFGVYLNRNNTITISNIRWTLWGNFGDVVAN